MFVVNEEDIPGNALEVEVVDNGFNVILRTDTEGLQILLADMKATKGLAVVSQYKKTLQAGFLSGGFYYSSDPEDLQDLNNAVMTGVNQEFKTLDGVMRQYTPAQIKKVLQDVTAAKLALVKNRDQMMLDIGTASTLAELDLII